MSVWRLAAGAGDFPEEWQRETINPEVEGKKDGRTQATVARLNLKFHATREIITSQE